MVRWILGSFHADFLFFVVPGFVGFLLAILLPTAFAPSALILAITVAIVDTGHGYITALRYQYKESTEKRRAFRVFTLVFLVCCLWVATGLPYFWSAVLYFTMYHHIRQYYGILAWYQALNDKKDTLAIYCLYLMTVLPIIGLHFRDLRHMHIYLPGDIFFVPSPVAFYFCMSLFASVFLFWSVREIWQGVNSKWKPNVFLIVTSAGLINGFCFFFGRSVEEIVYPVLLIHGVSYIGIISLSEERLSVKKSFLRAFALVAGVVFIAGVFEAFVTELSAVFDYMASPMSFWQILGTAFIATPAVWHYLMDAEIWRKNDKEFYRIIFPKGAIRK